MSAVRRRRAARVFTYRRGLPADAALAELRQGAGGQLDAAVVDAFVAVLAARPVAVVVA